MASFIQVEMSPTENTFSSLLPSLQSALLIFPHQFPSPVFLCSTKNMSNLWRSQPWLCPLPASPAQRKYCTLLLGARKDDILGKERGVFSWGGYLIISSQTYFIVIQTSILKSAGLIQGSCPPLFRDCHTASSL